MADRRLFSREILNSSVMADLAAANPEQELEAQRIWEALILMVDDYGRGKLLPAVIRAKAFGTTPGANSRLNLDFIISCMRRLEDKEKAIATWEVEGDVYFVLTKWEIHQGGVWRRRPSEIPEPPPEIRKLCWKKSDSGIERESERESDSGIERESEALKLSKAKLSQVKGSKEKKELTLELSNFDPSYSALVDELFPPDGKYRGWTPVQRLKQIKALDGLIRLDRFPREEVFSVLRWMRAQTEPHGDFPGWSAVFQSIPRLRENGQDKYRKAHAQWERSKRPPTQTFNQRLDDDSKWADRPTGKVKL